MKFKATVLSPLLVGDGRALSPVDYMVWKDQVNVLDQTRIFKLLARGPRLEGYLTQLRKATKLDFASWGGFAQNFSLRRIPFENAESTPVWNAAGPESLFIPTFAAGPRGAFLPASALKGALRTGLLASLWSQSTLERLASQMEGERLGRRATDSAEQQAGASQMRVLALGDSAPVPNSAFRVFLTRVASLNQGGQLAWKVAGRGSVPPQRMGEATPVFAEMAVPGTVFEGEWRQSDFLRQPELQRALGWRSEPSADELTKAANASARRQLEAHAEWARAARLGSVTAALDRLVAALASAESAGKNVCLLSLGWGGGFVSKGAFYNGADANLRKILRGVPSLSRALREGAPFPKTRRVIFQGGHPATLPGWVRLELLSQN